MKETQTEQVSTVKFEVGVRVRYTGDQKWRNGGDPPPVHTVVPGSIGVVRDEWYDERGHYASVEFSRRDEPIVFGSRDFSEGPYLDDLHVLSDQPDDKPSSGEEGPEELRRLLSW